MSNITNITNISCDELFLKYKESMFAYMRCLQTSTIKTDASNNIEKHINRSISCDLNNYLYFTKYRCFDYGTLTVQDYVTRYNLNIKKYKTHDIMFYDGELRSSEHSIIKKKFV